MKNKSNFVLAKTNDKHLELFLDSLSKYPDQSSAPQHVKSNLLKDKRTALQLIDDNNIIMKDAGKGRATVIMDKIFYKNKIEELLSDTENYILIKGGNQDESIMKKIEKLLQKFKEETTKAEKEYILKFSWKTSNFYGLSKIHKSKCINEAIKEQDADYIKLYVQAPNDLKFRPIVAGLLSPTHRLSNFVDLIVRSCSYEPG